MNPSIKGRIASLIYYFKYEQVMPSQRKDYIIFNKLFLGRKVKIDNYVVKEFMDIFNGL